MCTYINTQMHTFTHICLYYAIWMHSQRCTVHTFTNMCTQTSSCIYLDTHASPAHAHERRSRRIHSPKSHWHTASIHAVVLYLSKVSDRSGGTANTPHLYLDFWRLLCFAGRRFRSMVPKLWSNTDRGDSNTEPPPHCCQLGSSDGAWFIHKSAIKETC